MARKLPPQPQPVQLTPTQMRAGARQLQRRVDELAAINVEDLTDDNVGDILEDHRRPD
jgi:hypothetical protein